MPLGLRESGDSSREEGAETPYNIRGKRRSLSGTFFLMGLLGISGILLPPEMWEGAGFAVDKRITFVKMPNEAMCYSSADHGRM